ncbi:MAG: PqqD family protein [Thermoleophilia bacterium]|nr:PqqD family protein [Thermoleophilia bacterium]
MTAQLRLRNTDLAWRTVDDEMIAIDVRESTYLSANDSGAILWGALAAGTTKDELADRLVEAYGIDAGTAASDVERCLSDLRERGLLDETGATD